MPPYLRVTPTPTRGLLREATTARTRRAGRPRVRGEGRIAGARAAVAAGIPGAVHVRRQGERPRAHEGAVGHGAWSRVRMDEERGAEAAAHGAPDLSEPRRLPRDRRPAPRAGQGRSTDVPDRAATGDLVHRGGSDRARARERWPLARGGHGPRGGGQPCRAVQALTPVEPGERFECSPIQ